MSGRRSRGPGPDRQASGRAARVLRGLLLLGCGRADGLDWFNNDRDAVLSALAPPIGFIVVLALLLLLQKPSLPGLCLVVLLFCTVLLQPVLAELIARVWRRRPRWMLYATVSIWSVWLVIPAYVPAMLVASVLLQFGVDRVIASRAAALLLEAYFFWLHWFVVWKALNINRLQALGTVLVLTALFAALAFALEPLLATVTADMASQLAAS